MPPPRDGIWKRWLWVLLLTPGCSTLAPRSARVRDPLTAVQHGQLGTAYEKQGLGDLALEQYDAALRRDRRYIPGWIARGNVAFVRGDLKRAERCFRQALRVDRTHPGANNNLAMVYLVRGDRLDDAERLARVAQDQGGPLRPYALETLASVCAVGGRFAEATRWLDEADTIVSPRDDVLRQHLARTRAAIAAGVPVPSP